MASNNPIGPANQKKTAKVPTNGTSSGGKVPYHQAKIGKGFVAVPPRTGHSQKKNVK